MQFFQCSHPCILILRKELIPTEFQVINVKTLDFHSLDEYQKEHYFLLNPTYLPASGWSLVQKIAVDLLEKLNGNSIPLGEYTNGQIFRGIVTGFNDAFVIDEVTRQQILKNDSGSNEIIKPFFLGREIKRYQPLESHRYVIFTRRGIDIKSYPGIYKYLMQFKTRLLPKPKNWVGEWIGRKPGSYEWYEIQDSIDYFEEFDKPKIITPAIVKQNWYGNYKLSGRHGYHRPQASLGFAR